MYSRIIKFLSSPRTIYWAKTLSKFLSLQLVIQALNALSGILIVRTLSKQEYAYYTIANSLQSTMNILADSGISAGMMSIGGKIYTDDNQLAQLLNTGIRLRIYLGLIAVIFVTPLLFLFLTRNGSSIIYAILIITIILIELYLYLIQQIYAVIPLLRSNFTQIQYSDLISGGSRLLLILTFNLIFVNAVVYTFCSTIASGLRTFFLHKYNSNFLTRRVPINKDYDAQVISIVKTQVPYFLFFCVQGQVTTWLITIFGQSTNIAEYGALGRLGLLFAIIGNLVSQIVVPSFARCNSINLLKKRYLYVILTYVTFALLLMVIAYSFPSQLLWILGDKYYHLTGELPLIMLSSIISSVIGLMWGLNTSKGWVNDSWLIIPSTILTQILLLACMNLSTVKNVIIFGIFSLVPTVVVNLFMNLKGFIFMKESI